MIARDEYRFLDTRHPALRGAVEIRIQDRNPEPPGAQDTGELERQRALANPAFARADGDEMAHAGEPVGNAGALFGNLFEDPRSPVADDVVIPSHIVRVAYIGRPGAANCEAIPVLIE